MVHFLIELGPIISKHFEKLSHRTQKYLVEYRWEHIRCQELAPVFERILSQELTEYDYWASEILKAYYELEPEKAQKLIIEDIQRPKHKFGSNALSLLPAQSLAQFDTFFVSVLETRSSKHDLFTMSAMINRYASGSIFPSVEKFYIENEGRWACEIQNNLLSYWIRCDAQSGLNALKRAMTKRKETGRYKNTVPEVLKMVTNNDQEKIALDYLNDSDPEVGRFIADYLRKNGSDKSVVPLINRIIEWKAQWAENDSYILLKEHQIEPNVYFGNILFETLIEGKKWKLTKEQIGQISKIIWSQQQRNRLKYYKK